MERKYKLGTMIIAAALLLPLLTDTAYANSSWRWAAETRPWDVLPVVIIGANLATTAVTFVIERISCPGSW